MWSYRKVLVLTPRPHTHLKQQIERTTLWHAGRLLLEDELHRAHGITEGTSKSIQRIQELLGPCRVVEWTTNEHGVIRIPRHWREQWLDHVQELSINTTPDIAAFW